MVARLWMRGQDLRADVSQSSGCNAGYPALVGSPRPSGWGPSCVWNWLQLELALVRDRECGWIVEIPVSAAVDERAGDAHGTAEARGLDGLQVFRGRYRHSDVDIAIF